MGWVDRQCLEQRTHFAVVGQAVMRGKVGLKRRSCQPLGKTFGAGVDAEATQKNALWDQVAAAGRGGSAGKRFEIHMGGQIGLTGFGKRIGEAVILQRLKRIPARPPVAVIHDQRRPAPAQSSSDCASAIWWPDFWRRSRLSW